MLPFLALDNATDFGPGPTKDLEGVYGKHTLHVWYAGDPTGRAVKLNGSLDGVHWFGMATWRPGDSTVLTVEHLARYVSASLGGTSGGTAFSAIIASA
ncbi:hypothetical protein [Nonomuraea sp. NPDC023979]|uniref:hypothetical protein n=1 Tax=Nonomuraea sp. NPDC023979 TaxID=3154796 RepID=UPI0033E32E4F